MKQHPEAFKNEEIRVLNATDVAAGGLDISDRPYVFNYDMLTIQEVIPFILDTKKLSPYTFFETQILIIIQTRP